MKKILSLLFFLFIIRISNAATFNTITLTVTNGTTNGSTFTLNGSVRSFTNSVALPTSQILTNSSAGGSATNLLNHFGTYGIAGISQAKTGTNVVTFYGFGITASASAGWATVSSSSSTSTNNYVVAVPMSTYSPTNQTNIPSMLISDLNNLSQVAINQTNTVASELVGKTNVQSISGVKTFTGANVYSNSAQRIIGGTNSFTVGFLTNGYWTNAALSKPTINSGLNEGAAFRSVGDGSDSEQLGYLAEASGDFSTAIGDASKATAFYSSSFGVDSVSSAEYSTAIGSQSRATGLYSSAFGYAATALEPYATAIGTAAQIYTNAPNGTAIGVGATIANSTNGTAVGAGTIVSHNNSTALGYNSTTRRDNEVVLGGAGIDTYVRNILQVGDSFTNGVFTGNQTNRGSLGFIQLANSSLANGNNSAVNSSTNVYLKVSGPTAAFSINGIIGGRDGRLLVIENATGYAMTIANDSGVDPTAANRIYTGAGMDINVTNNPGYVLLIYDASVSRWNLIQAGNGATSVGEANTISSTANNGAVLTADVPKVGVDLRLKTVLGSNGISVSTNATNITFSGVGLLGTNSSIWRSNSVVIAGTNGVLTNLTANNKGDLFVYNGTNFTPFVSSTGTNGHVFSKDSTKPSGWNLIPPATGSSSGMVREVTGTYIVQPDDETIMTVVDESVLIVVTNNLPNYKHLYFVAQGEFGALSVTNSIGGYIGYGLRPQDPFTATGGGAAQNFTLHAQVFGTNLIQLNPPFNP